MRTTLFLALLLPPLVAHQWCAAQGVPDEQSFFQGICVAFESHALQDGRIASCMVLSNEVNQSVALGGDHVSERDLDDLCASIGGKPAQGGNLGISVSNANGQAIERPCQVALPYRRPMRRVPVH